MVRHVRKMDESVFSKEPEKVGNVAGGEDFQYCVQLFLDDDMEIKNLAFHTRRWHKENLHYVQKTLTKLNLPSEPNCILEESI